MEYGKDAKVDIAMRVIADHVRTIAFSIADPSCLANAKAGYVIRRILRRAVRYAYTFLGQKQAFMYRLVDTLIGKLGRGISRAAQTARTHNACHQGRRGCIPPYLENGIRLLDNAIEQARGKKGLTEISGKEAFQLYDTYGFPLDLTDSSSGENDMTLDHSGFDTEMAAQKARASNTQPLSRPATA